VFEQRFVAADLGRLVGAGAVLFEPQLAARRSRALRTSFDRALELGATEARQIDLQLEIEPEHVGHPAKQIVMIGAMRSVFHFAL